MTSSPRAPRVGSSSIALLLMAACGAEPQSGSQAGSSVPVSSPGAAGTQASALVPARPQAAGVLAAVGGAGPANGQLDAAVATAASAGVGGVAATRTPASSSAVDEADAGEPRAAGGAKASASSVPTLPVFEAKGQPLAAADSQWTYIEFPDTQCRDGSHAGISLSLRAPSKKLMIFLEGGVYCFDDTTCAVNPSNVDDTVFNSAKVEPTAGIFDRKNPQNPVRDWNIVYVPYCSGDAMGGTKSTPSDVPAGPSGQIFAGHLNMQKFLQRIVPTFRDASDVLLTGISAGGVSVMHNWSLVQSAFPQVKVRAINDSGLPPASPKVLAECLQDEFRTLWGLDDSVLAECGADCPNHKAYWQDHALHLVKLFADRPSGYIDALGDGQMRALCGVGLRNCTGNILFDSVAADVYRDELLAFRDTLKPFANYGTFLPEGDQHTWLKDNSFYSGSAGGMKLADWFAKIANGEAAGDAGGSTL